MQPIIIVILILAILYLLLKGKKKSTSESNFNESENIENQSTSKTNDITVYFKKDYTFTKNELFAYRDIKKIADKCDLVVFPKMRLADICGVTKGTKYWNAYFSKIKSKHIDFVLCDNKLCSPMIAIELDDSTHQREDRKKRDAFVNDLMNHIGIPILHIYNTQGLDEKIKGILSN